MSRCKLCSTAAKAPGPQVCLKSSAPPFLIPGVAPTCLPETGCLIPAYLHPRWVSNSAVGLQEEHEMKHHSLALWWGTAQTPGHLTREPIQAGLRIAPIRCHPDKYREFEKFLNFVLFLRIIQPISGDIWKRKWQPTPVFLPGKSHGQRRLAGYSPWGCKEMDTTLRLDNKGSRRHSRDQANWSVDNLESAPGAYQVLKERCQHNYE